MKNIALKFIAGEKIGGKYLGQFIFSGTIKSTRYVQVPNGPKELTVALDYPIWVFGAERDTIAVYVNDDGSYSKYGSDSNIVAI